MNPLPPLQDIPVVVSESCGDNAVYVVEDVYDWLSMYPPLGWDLPPARRLLERGARSKRPRLLGSTRGFGALMACNLAAAYRPEVPR